MAMKRGDAGSSSSSKFSGGIHSDEAYEQELKALLFKKSIKNKGKGTTYGGHQGQGHGIHNHQHYGRRSEYIERLVLETDTLPGLALLYNSTVGEIKKLNHLYTEQDLHARRIIKVPSRGILINLEDPVEATTSAAARDKLQSLSSTATVNITSNLTYEEDESEINANDQMTLYLNTKDNFLQEIREKAENVAANSPILNDDSSNEDTTQPRLTRRKATTLKWWHIFVPCLSFIIIFPILLFLLQEHIFDRSSANETEHHHSTPLTMSSS